MLQMEEFSFSFSFSFLFLFPFLCPLPDTGTNYTSIQVMRCRALVLVRSGYENSSPRFVLLVVLLVVLGHPTNISSEPQREPVDEIKKFEEGRSVSASEAIYK